MSLRESFTRNYDVNVAGTHVLTHALAPLLLASAAPRLLFITGLARITEAGERYFPTAPQPAGWPKPPLDFDPIAYRCTKVALNMLMLDWNFKLRADGVKVWCVAPGLMATDLGGQRELAGQMGGAHPREGAALVRSVVEGARDADVGRVVGKNGMIQW